MKRAFLFTLGVLLALVMGACGISPEDLAPLDPHGEGVDPSIAQFEALEAMGEGEGEYFKAKMVACHKIRFAQPGYDYTKTVFLYKMALVPKFANPAKPLDIKLHPTNGVDAYFEELYKDSSTLPDDLGILNNNILADYSEQGFTSEGRNVAVGFVFYLSNDTDQLQEKYGVDDATYTQGMTTLRIDIRCGQLEDSFELPFTGELAEITSEDDPIAKSDPRVMSLLLDGGAQQVFGGLDALQD